MNRENKIPDNLTIVPFISGFDGSGNVILKCPYKLNGVSHSAHSLNEVCPVINSKYSKYYNLPPGITNSFIKTNGQ
jgi:hypothetical protein